jgi:Protein of unknown function (DUF3551)
MDESQKPSQEAIMRLSFTMLGVAAAMAAAVGGAQAQNYPWCAQYSGGTGGARNCGFTTFQQCLENVSGIGGFCQLNNTYVPPAGPAHRASKHRSHKTS